MDYTGTGNTLNVRSPQVLKLIMDSLRYWVLEMHVDASASTWPRRLRANCMRWIACPRSSTSLIRPGNLASQVDRRAVGRGRRAAIRWDAFRRSGPNGTAAIAMSREATGKATAGNSPSSRTG